ncbi:MAG: NGG1p interacting factor NIF3, partial [Elusimicrobiota bacterium]|nr:NGG1p interacting factor NIF3 [Elusimicrobiota bacterium]
VEEGIKEDVRTASEIDRILKENKEKYEKLEGVEKEIFDTHTLKSPYADSRIMWGEENSVINKLWVGIDVDTSELLMIKNITEGSRDKPLVIAHHPFGRAYTNFYEVMDMQADILSGEGVTSSVAQNLTRSRKSEVARKVSGANHFKAQDAARLLDIPVMNIHTPADNHVKAYLDKKIRREDPAKLKDLIEMLLEIPEYKDSAGKGQPPTVLNGDEKNKCGKIFVDMTGGTEGNHDILKDLVKSGVSTVVGMHMSEKHYKKAKEENLNVIIAGHISSDNIGLNLLLDKVIDKFGNIEIENFSGFIRVQRND